MQTHLALGTRHSLLAATLLAGASGALAWSSLAPSVARADVRTEARAHFRRGMALIAEGRLDAGVAALQVAYEILPDPNVLYEVARAYAQSGRYEEAIEQLERYLESDPDDRAEVMRSLAAIRQALVARAARADAAASETRESEPEPEADLELRAAEEDVYQASVVSASRSAQSALDAPASTAVIPRQDLRLSGLLSIPEVLRRVAGLGVAMTTPVDGQIGIRGFDQRLSSRVLVLVDGRSTFLDTVGGTLWGALPIGPWDIERIEIVRGPASALYGANAFSGVLNIITRPAGPPATEAITGTGNGGTVFGHAQTSGRLERLAYRVAAGYVRTERFSLGAPALASDGAFANASFRYRIVPEVQLRLEGGLAQRLLTLQTPGPLFVEPTGDSTARGPAAHVLGSLETPYGSIRASYAHVDLQAQRGSAPIGREPARGDFTTGTLDVEAELAQRFELLVQHDLRVGASYRRKTVRWDFLAQPYEQNHYALFLHDAMQITEWLSVVGSLRADFHPLLAAPVFSPRGAAVVRPSAGSSIRASIGTGFRPPTFLESYLDLERSTAVPGVHVLARGALGLRPERILSAELGYRNEESELVDVELNAYYNRVDDRIATTQVQPFRLGDLADGYSPSTGSFALGTITFENETPIFDVVGGEAIARVHPVQGLDLYANYAISTTFMTTPEGATGVLRTDDAPTSTHRVNAGIQYRSDFGLEISVDFHFVSDQRWLEQTWAADDGRGAVLAELDVPAYYLVDARIGYRLLDDALDLGLVGTNITDHRHRQHPLGQELSARFMFTAAYRM
ncbi:MAG: TonB-dependent receptor [Myxococcota bacterium]|nr:TonB-dependent receptor [Myxococcota bacterium]